MEENMPYNQDPRLRPPEAGQNNHQQPPPLQKCPRCNSTNTKFCYYNNYSLSQPRYYCKGCRRYWTQGGTLRNVPVGGGCRKSKRPKISRLASSESEIARSQALPGSTHPGQDFIMSGLEPGMCSNSFYGGGSLLSSLAALQTINQPLFEATGGKSGDGFGSNMALLHGVNGSSLRPQVPPQQFNNDFFPSPHGMMNSLNEAFVNRDDSTTSARVGGNLWSDTALEDGDHHACSSFNPNQSSGVDPSE